MKSHIKEPIVYLKLLALNGQRKRNNSMAILAKKKKLKKDMAFKGKKTRFPHTVDRLTLDKKERR
jgi:hypothetical protein